MRCDAMRAFNDTYLLLFVFFFSLVSLVNLTQQYLQSKQTFKTASIYRNVFMCLILQNKKREEKPERIMELTE